MMLNESEVAQLEDVLHASSVMFWDMLCTFSGRLK